MSVHMQLSLISPPPELNQPEPETGSVTASPSSAPVTMVTPSSALLSSSGAATTFAPQLSPESGMYGRLIYARGPLICAALWYAHHCVPNPEVLRPCGVATTNKSLAPLPPKWVAPARASAATSASVGLCGTLLVWSNQTPASCIFRFAM